MATVIWYLQVNAVKKSLTAWDIKSTTLSKKSLAADELNFSMPVADILQDSPIAYGDTVLLLRDAVCVFSGTVVHVTANFGAEEERIGVTCYNAWWNLERIIYQQKHVINRGTIALPNLWMTEGTRVVLGQDVWGNKQTTVVQIEEISGYAQTRGSGFGTIPAMRGDLIPPFTECRDITCAQAIMRMLEYTPDVSSFMYYDPDTGEQTLMLKQRDYMEVVPLNLDGTRVANVDGLKPRTDMRPTGVIFTFITMTRDPVTQEAIPVETQQIAGLSSGIGVIAATIELAIQGSATPEPIPANLAGLYYNALQAIFWEGAVTLHERECSVDFHPAQRINLGFGRAEWASMNAMVVAVTHNLDAGTTEIEFGLPKFLSQGDFFDLMTRFRQGGGSGDFTGTKHNGDQGVPPDKGGDGSKPGGTGSSNPSAGKPSGGLVSGGSFSSDFCQDGVPVTKTVQGV